MAPRSFLSSVLAALLAVLIAAPADAQLRATAVREVAAGEVYGEAAAAALADGSFLVAWGVEGGVQMRAVDAAGTPTGPLRTVVLGSKYVSADEIVLLSDALVVNEYDSSSGVRRTTVRRLGADVGSPVTVFGSGLRGVHAVRRAGGSGGSSAAAVGGGTPRAVYAPPARRGRDARRSDAASPARASATAAPVPRAGMAPGRCGPARAARTARSGRGIKEQPLSSAGTAVGSPVRGGAPPDVAVHRRPARRVPRGLGSAEPPPWCRARSARSGSTRRATGGAAFHLSAARRHGDASAGPSVAA